MSLSRILEKDDVREKLKSEFPKKRYPRNLDPISPPLTENYKNVGIAFDYLLRFYVKRLNPKAITSEWVAEKALNIIESNLDGINEYKNLSKNIGEEVFPLVGIDENQYNYLKKIYQKANVIIADAKYRYSRYIASGKIENKLLKSVLLLSQLDIIMRTGSGYLLHNPYLGDIDRRRIRVKDVNDLRTLHSLLNPDLFRAKKIVILNPTFGSASDRVGGADADILIDDMLIEIKTTKKMQITRKIYNQLIGYYTLYRIGGIDGLPKNRKLKKFGIYYSRFGELVTMNIDEIIDKKRFQNYLEWFIKRTEGVSRIVNKI